MKLCDAKKCITVYNIQGYTENTKENLEDFEVTQIWSYLCNW